MAKFRAQESAVLARRRRLWQRIPRPGHEIYTDDSKQHGASVGAKMGYPGGEPPLGHLKKSAGPLTSLPATFLPVVGSFACS